MPSQKFRIVTARAARAALVLMALAMPPASAGEAPAAPPTPTSASPDVTVARAGARLLAAYPGQIGAIEGNAIVWRDGSRSPLDDGRGIKPFADWLAQPDIEDMLQAEYAAGPLTAPPLSDPGRARNEEFFTRMYGDCRTGGVASNLVEVEWLPKRYGKPIRVTRINGVADRITAISRELDLLPRNFDRYLYPPGGTYVCRDVAGTALRSAHGYGIAIDIAVAPSDYWRWAAAKGAEPPLWRNRIPDEIVAIFEKHGFIWGGKWRHFDTMHFEYRPELLPPQSAQP